MFPLYLSHKTWMSGQSNILLWKKPKLWIFSFWFPSASTVTRKYLESRTKWKQKFDEQLSAHVASIRMTSPNRLWILPTLKSVINCAREFLPRNGAREQTSSGLSFRKEWNPFVPFLIQKNELLQPIRMQLSKNGANDKACIGFRWR